MARAHLHTRIIIHVAPTCAEPSGPPLPIYPHVEHRVPLLATAGVGPAASQLGNLALRFASDVDKPVAADMGVSWSDGASSDADDGGCESGEGDELHGGEIVG
jgi:hypothetical protein